MRKRTWIQIILFIILLAVGVGIAKYLISKRKAPPRFEREVPAPLVKTQTLRLQDIQMVVLGNGTVRAKTMVQVVPQVPGKALTVSPDFVNGGFFAADQTLIQIEPDDYELALQRAQAGVARAQVQLDLQKAEGDVSRQEWRAIHPDKEPSSPLVFRIPQIKQAQAELDAAQAELAAAQLALKRTKISLPFNGRVVAESVDAGQFLVVGQPVATVYGTDVMEIPVPLEDRELAWFDVPISPDSGKEKSSAPQKQTLVDIYADFAGSRHHWLGRLVRTEGVVNPASRMINVVIEVEKPLVDKKSSFSLLPGMFVDAAIRGHHLKKIILVPRYAVHNRNEVWLIKENKLYIKEVNILRRDKKYAYVDKGLEDQDVIVTSPLDTVTDGMKVRPESELGQTEQRHDDAETLDSNSKGRG